MNELLRRHEQTIALMRQRVLYCLNLVGFTFSVFGELNPESHASGATCRIPRRRAGAPGLHILIASADALDSFRGILLLPSERRSYGVIQRIGRALAALHGESFQLGFTRG